MEQFVQRFIQKYNITQQEADMLLAESVPVEFSRSEKIVNEGEINSDLYIVSHGVWRAYRLKDGIEMSMWFAIEGSLAFSVTGYAGEQASKLFIESLNRSRAHRISRHRLCELFSQSQEWADLGRRLSKRTLFMPAEKNARTDSTNPSQTFGLIPEHDPPITQPYTGLSGPIAATILHLENFLSLSCIYRRYGLFFLRKICL